MKLKNNPETSGMKSRFLSGKKLILFTVLYIISVAAKSQFNITGTVQDQPFTQFMTGARITLFNTDTTFFRESRANVSGNYSFINIPSNTYSLGVSYLGKQYQQITINVSSNSNFNFNLLPETQQGQWNVIVQSPEALGGTDLAILRPDGKIFYCHNTKDPFVFNPATNDTTLIQGDANVQGCAAPLLMPDGKIIFVGGADVAVYGPGTRKVKTYDYLTGLWQPKPDMIGYRWYPTMTRLTDGKLLVTGGGTQFNPQRTNTTEIYDPVAGTSQMVDTTAIRQELSPIVMLNNGKVLMTHRPPQLYNPVTQLWDACADFQQGNRMSNGDHADHELVYLPEGNVIAVGFKSFTASPGNFIEKYNYVTNSWSYGTNFNPIRSRPKTVLLPGKNILVIAGQKEDAADTTSTNQWGYMNLTDIYNPYTDQWRHLARMNHYREYHSLPVLVPDGRVIIVGGEGQPGNEPPFSVIEAFKPPYLFRGVRPEIVNFSQSNFQRGSQIVFDVVKTDSVSKVILMSTPSISHFMNCGNNRYVELTFTQTGNNIITSIPMDSLNVLDGYYQLFAMVDDIPSVSKIIKVQNSITGCVQPSAIITLAGPTTFCAGGSVVLNAPLAINRAYQWKRGGLNIAGATQSSYTAVAGGTYKVTVTNTLSGCSKTTANGVMVTKNPFPSATIYPAGTISFCAGQSALLTANAGTGYAYKWKKNGSYITGAVSITYTVITAGKYRVEVTNANGCSKTSLTDTVVVPCRIGDIDKANNIFINPNPAQNSFTVTVPDEKFNITITDATGRKVFEMKSIAEQTEINSKEFSNGIYFIDVITVEEKSFREKIIISK